MKFKIEIKETLAEVIEIEADSEEEALAMVRDAYHAEEIILDANHFIDVEFSIYDES